MDIISKVSDLRQRLASGNSIAFVPTMGNLHEGHLQLVRTAKQFAKCVVVSIFVNPLQFGANEDLASYPRTLVEDCKKLAAIGVDVVYAPGETDNYPSPQTMTFNPPRVANDHCGIARPGQFSGVATLVLKLIIIVRPQVAVFGKNHF